MNLLRTLHSLEFSKYMPPFVQTKLKNKRKRKRELVMKDEITKIYQKAADLLVKETGHKDIGDYLEFGVFKGTSLSCMFKVVEQLELSQVRLFGFDSFEGLPDTASIDDEGAWKPGDYSYPFRQTKRYLTNRGIDWTRTFLIKGFYSDTLNDQLKQKYEMKKAGIIMIDCDMYLSAKEALSFCAPFIQERAVIVFDDWASGNDLSERNLGEKKAFDEFLKNHPKLKANKIDRYKDIFGKTNGIAFLVTNES